MSLFPTDFWAGSKRISLCPFTSLFAIWFFHCYQGNPSTHPPTGELSIQCKLLSGAIIRLLLKPYWDMSVSRRNFKQVGAETIASAGGLRMRRAAGSVGRMPVALPAMSHKNCEQSSQTDRSQDVPMWIRMERGKRGSAPPGLLGCVLLLTWLLCTPSIFAWVQHSPRGRSVALSALFWWRG